MNDCVIVMPAYNPEPVLVYLVKCLLNAGFHNILCVNDGSSPDCQGIFDELKELTEVVLIEHAVNLGKGRAIKTAFNYICSHYSGISSVITMDADGQHTVEAVEKLYRSYEKNEKLLLGSRKFTDKRAKVPFRSRLGNIITRYVFRYLCNLDISDTQTGLRLYPYSILAPMLKVGGEGYEFETNCLLYCKENNIEIQEVEIETIYEDNNTSSHFNPLRDSIRIYTVICKYMFASFLSVIIDNFVFCMISRANDNVFVMIYSGRAVAAIINFLINRKIVFKNTQEGLLRQIVRYILLLIISGTVSAMLVSWGEKILLINILVIKIFVDVMLFFINFYIQKNYVFEKAKQ